MKRFILILTLILVWVILMPFEQAFLYFPENKFLSTPAEIGLDFQDQWMTTSSGRKIHGWFIPHPQAQATLLFFHGNAGNISHRIDKLKIFYELQLSTFIIDYAGYGQSEGKPSEKNLYEDGRAAYQQTIEKLKIDPRRLFLYGESLGCAVAIELAQKLDVAGIILEGAFTSLRELSKKHMPLLVPFAGSQYDNLEKISQLKVPILFTHSKQDEICPFKQALQLYEKTTAPKQSVWFETGGHNDGFFVNRESYEKGLSQFLNFRMP